MSGLGTQDTPAWVPTGVTAWTALTPYVAGAVVTNGGKVYEANATFTSGASFNAANWTQLGAQDGTYVGMLPAATGVAAADAAIWQAAHDALPATGGRITPAAGGYTFGTNVVTFTKKVKVSGAGGLDPDGNYGTAILYSGTTGGPIDNQHAGSVYEDIAILNTAGTTPTAGQGIFFTDGRMCRLTRVDIRGFWNDVDWGTNSFYETMQNCNFLDPINWGAYLHTTSPSADWGDCSIAGCVFANEDTSHNPLAAVRWESGGGIRFIGNKVNAGANPAGGAAGTFSYGIDAAVADGVTTSDLIVADNSIENWTVAGVNVHQIGTTGVFGHTSVTGTQFLGRGTGTCVSVMPTTAADVYDVVLGHNILSNATTGYQVQNVSSLLVGPYITDGVTNPLSMLGGVDRAKVVAPLARDDGVTVYANGSIANNFDQLGRQDRLSFGRNATSVSTSVYTTLWRVGLGQFAGAFLTVTIFGNVTGKGQCVWKGDRLVTRASGACTVNTAGTDVTDGFAGTSGTPFDVLFDTAAVSGEVQIKVRLDSVTGGTSLFANATLTTDPVASVHQGA